MTPQTCCLCVIRARDGDIVTALKSFRWHTAETDWWLLLLLSLSRKRKKWRAQAKRTQNDGLNPAISQNIATPDPVRPTTPPSASALSPLFSACLRQPLLPLRRRRSASASQTRANAQLPRLGDPRGAQEPLRFSVFRRFNLAPSRDPPFCCERFPLTCESFRVGPPARSKLM